MNFKRIMASSSAMSPVEDVMEVASEDGQVNCVMPPSSPARMPNPGGELEDALSASGVRVGGVSAQSKMAGKRGRLTQKKKVDKTMGKEPVLAVKITAVVEAKAKFELQSIARSGFEIAGDQRYSYVHLGALGGKRKQLDRVSGRAKGLWQNSGLLCNAMSEYCASTGRIFYKS